MKLKFLSKGNIGIGYCLLLGCIFFTGKIYISNVYLHFRAPNIILCKQAMYFVCLYSGCTLLSSIYCIIVVYAVICIPDNALVSSVWDIQRKVQFCITQWYQLTNFPVKKAKTTMPPKGQCSHQGHATG